MNKNTKRARYTFLVVSAAVFLAACSSEVQPEPDADEFNAVKTVRANETTLHYVDAGQGTPVVFVHGTLGDYRTWDAQVETVSKKYRAISYSRRLHFPNDFPSDALESTTYNHLEDLRAFIQALGIERMHLVGHSGGGAISLLFAREYPEYLISLTLGEPAVSELIADLPEGAALREGFGETVYGPTTEAFRAGKDEEGVRLFIDGVQGDAKGFDDLPARFRERMLQNAPSLRKSRLSNVSRPRLTCADANKIRIPTLLIHGEVSPKMFLLINDVLEECLPNVERAALAGTSHSLEMENPEGFNEIVLEFIERHEDVWEPFAGALAYTQRRNLKSETTGRTYQISVALPEDHATSNETYPVLYAVDANIEFGTVAETARLQHQFGIIPELIIVGIGYPVDRFAESQELRQGDICREGDREGFLTFIREELIPLVELEFRASSSSRALFGHSCGGEFALYALFKGEGTFERFIAGSINRRDLFPLESTYAESHDSLRAQLFISTGLLLDEPFPEDPPVIRELVTILESRNYDGLEIKTAYIEDETHITVIPATIGRGLRAIYEDFPGVVSQ